MIEVVTSQVTAYSIMVLLQAIPETFVAIYAFDVSHLDNSCNISITTSHGPIFHFLLAYSILKIPMWKDGFIF